jgi:RNA-directed DNA polymerase
MQRARERIREITAQRRLLVRVEVIVQELNSYLRGWANYFRYGNSRLHFTRITTYALRRLALFVAKRHKRRSGYGMTVVAGTARGPAGLKSAINRVAFRTLEAGSPAGQDLSPAGRSSR